MEINWLHWNSCGFSQGFPPVKTKGKKKKNKKKINFESQQFLSSINQVW